MPVTIAKLLLRAAQTRLQSLQIATRSRQRDASSAALTIALAAVGIVAPASQAWSEALAAPEGAVLASRMADYTAPVPGSLLALNPFHAIAEGVDEDGNGVRLTSMNVHANSWYILEISSENGRTARYHLENSDPQEWQISLTEAGEIYLESAEDAYACAPWQDGELAEAAATGLPYAPVCDWALFVRNAVSGNRSSREAVSQFLRDNVLFGDSLVNLIKGAFYEDRFMASSEELAAEDPGAVVALLGQAALDRRPAMRPRSGIEVEGADNGAMQAGSWYAVEDAPGVFHSTMQSGMIARSVFDSAGGANRLDGAENGADIYLMAFDLSRFEIGYEVGTDHPRVDWSPRPSGAGRNYNTAGPDGFGTTAPLVRVGMISPSLTDRIAATFTGGFKREHGAWRFGPRAQANWGNHYGFMSNGVILSRLWPGLATLYMTDDGTVGMTTWSAELEQELLPRLVFARQNGVPLIENGVPGAEVQSWGGGNWSGSANADLRTLRSGACIREVEGRSFLIYAYFSAATPSGQARTFQAYGCDYAMILDMNSPELTYAAVYVQDEEAEEIRTMHLADAMASVDLTRRDGTRIPRFLSYADNRDFFYLARRE